MYHDAGIDNDRIVFMNKKQDSHKILDFPLMLGGPLYQLYLRTFLVKPPLNLPKRRIVVVLLISWVPLLLLALIGGVAYRGVEVPFLFDFDTHARLLIALGLFIGAERVAHQHLQIVVNQFIDRDIITPDIRARFNHIITSALKLRNSYVAELLLLVLVYTVGHFSWIRYSSLGGSTWYSAGINGHSDLTMAGYWYVYVSIPIFQFILCRWYYRMFIWYRFLWQVSRLPLRLNCLHPDRAGGLGFLNMSVSVFQVGLLAHTVVLAGLIINGMWYAGKTLLQFKLPLVSLLLFLLFLVLIPLAFFIIPLADAKRKGLVDYGILADKYVNNFSSKWMGKKPHKDETLLGNADIQTLSDLSSSFNIANEMRLVPFNRNTVIWLVLMIVSPILPLLLTIMPISKMINDVINIIL